MRTTIQQTYSDGSLARRLSSLVSRARLDVDRPKNCEVRYIDGKLEVYFRQNVNRWRWLFRSFFNGQQSRGNLGASARDGIAIQNAVGHKTGWYKVYDEGATTHATGGYIVARLVRSSSYDGDDWLGCWFDGKGRWHVDILFETLTLDASDVYPIDPPADGTTIMIAQASSAGEIVTQHFTGTPVTMPLSTDAVVTMQAIDNSSAVPLRCASVSMMGQSLSLFNFAPSAGSVGTTGTYPRSPLAIDTDFIGLPSGTSGIDVLVRINRADGTAGQRVYLHYATIDDLLAKSPTTIPFINQRLDLIEGRLDALEGA